MTQHTATTPRPWRAEGLDIIGNEPNGSVCSCSGRSANAAFIVKACNSFDYMLEALESIAESEPTAGYGEFNAMLIIEAIDIAKDAIKRARGEGMSEYSTGAIQAAAKIADGVEKWGFNFVGKNAFENIIESETHASEMLAFIEKVADGTLSGWAAQTEALTAIKKWRGTHAGL